MSEQDEPEEMDRYTVALIKQLRLIRDEAIHTARQVDVTLTMLGDPLAGSLGGRREEQAERRAFMQQGLMQDDASLATGRDVTTLMQRVRKSSPATPHLDSDTGGDVRTPHPAPATT